MDRIPAFASANQPEEPVLQFRLRSDPPTEPVARIRKSLCLLLEDMVQYSRWQKYLDNVHSTDHERIIEYEILHRAEYVRKYLTKLFDALPGQIPDTSGLFGWLFKGVKALHNSYCIQEALRERDNFERRSGLFKPATLGSLEAHMGFDVSRSLEEDIYALVPEQRLLEVRGNVHGAAKYVIGMEQDVQWDAKRALFPKKEKKG
jgi:hypothetical protein